jgi:hypothetical protein
MDVAATGDFPIKSTKISVPVGYRKRFELQQYGIPRLGAAIRQVF